MTTVPDAGWPPVALTIAGFDPTSGAGATADLQVFASYGLFGTACLTALTVQSTVGVERVEVTEARLLKEMLDALTRDIPPAGIKIGMLGDAAATRVVAEFVRVTRRTRAVPVVVDPVLRSSSGTQLLEDAGVRVLLESLLPEVRCVTPNRGELAVLLGREHVLVDDLVEAAAELLRRTGAESVVVTGGDEEVPRDLVLVRDEEPVWLVGQRVETAATHGTGCAFSSALLSRLVIGDELRAAAREAKAFVERSLRSAPDLGAGRGPMKLSGTPYVTGAGIVSRER